MEVKKYDEKISEYESEKLEKLEYDKSYLEDFDFADGKKRQEDDLKNIRDLEELLGTKDMNVYGTNNKEVFAEKVDEMTTTDLQNLAIKIGIPPTKNRLELKTNIKRSFDIYARKNSIGYSMQGNPIIDPSSPNYESTVRLFKEGL